MGAGGSILASMLLLQRYLRQELQRPELIHAPLEDKELEDKYLTQEVRLLLREYWPHPVLEFSGYVSTLWSAFWAAVPSHVPVGDIELLTLQDGGTVSLDWGPKPERTGRERIVLVLPGMCNHSGTSFIQTTMRHLKQAGFRAVALNYRGVGGLQLTSPKIASFDSWQDLHEVVEHIATKYPDGDIFAVGFSMGSLILLRHLGEEGHRARIKAGVAIAAPVDFRKAIQGLESTPKRLALNFAMAQSLKLTLLSSAFKSEHTRAVNKIKAWRALTMRQLDEATTCKLNGYSSPEEMYDHNDPKTVISQIAVPTLVVNAEDDPVVTVRALPFRQMRRNPRLYVAVTRRGGHIGWGSGGLGGACWTDAMAVDFLLACSLRGARPSRL